MIAKAEFKTMRLTARALALVFLVVATMAMATNVTNPFGADFISFWAASVLALGGDAAAAYRLDAHHAVQAGVADFQGMLPFFYPPPFLIVALPLGLLPYWAAAALWIVATFAAYLAAARRLLPGAGWLVAAYPAVIVNAITGQNGFLTAAIFIAGLLALPKRPLAAGMLLGCLIIKPHLALLLPLAFIAAGQWRAFAGAALSSLGLLLLALAMFGPGSYAEWVGQAPVYASILADGSVGWHKMASVYGSLRLAGAPAQLACAIHGAIALCAVAAVWLVWRKQPDPGAKAAALAAATLLVSPYLFLYDTLILVVPFLWLLSRGERQGLLAALWCVPLIGVAQNWGFNTLLNLTPLVSIAVLVLVCRQILLGDAAEGAAEGQGTSPVALAAE
jgi:alpha-1,2-mannosyltransferase